MWSCVSLWEHPSRELLRLSAWSLPVLHLRTITVVHGDLRVARRDVAPLPSGQRVLPPRAAAASAAITLGGVVNHHHGGIHSRQRVYAALARRVQPRRAQFQLVVAGHLDERAPTKRSLEAGSKPGATSRGRGEELANTGQAVVWKVEREQHTENKYKLQVCLSIFCNWQSFNNIVFSDKCFMFSFARSSNYYIQCCTRGWLFRWEEIVFRCPWRFLKGI